MAQDRLTVLHVLEALRGGTSRHLVEVVTHAPGITHHVAVPIEGRAAPASGARIDEPALEVMAARGATIHRVDTRRSAAHPVNLLAALRIRRLGRAVGADLLHGHSAVGGAVARLAGAGTGIPVVYTPHGLRPGRASIMVERLLGRGTAAIVALSASEQHRLTDLRLAPPERVALVPNGIDTTPMAGATVDLRRRLGLEPGTPLVGTVARLVPQKAPEVFVGVCAEIRRVRPDVHFLLIGGGPRQAALDQAVASAGIGPVWHQIEHLPNAGATLGQLDVFVLASAYEGGPYAPLEAMLGGAPVVLSDVVGNRDVVEPGVSGCLAPAGDTVALAAAVLELLSDPLRRAAVAEAGRRRVVERYDVRATAGSLAALYRRVTDRVPANRPRKPNPGPEDESSASPDDTGGR